jgi:hypothetical protein
VVDEIDFAVGRSAKFGNELQALIIVLLNFRYMNSFAIPGGGNSDV